MTLRYLPFLFAVASALLFSTKAFAQTDERRCGSAELLQQQIAANPALLQLIEKQEADIARWMEQNQGNATRAVVTIPVVVHLVYNPGVNSIFTDHQVKDQIDILNEDFRRLNGDTYKTPSDFSGVAAGSGGVPSAGSGSGRISELASSARISPDGCRAVM